MAGHSKWKKIQFKKGKQDKDRSKIHSKYVQKIKRAAKNDPKINNNHILRAIIDIAKKKGLSNEIIERCLSSTEKETTNEVIYEAFIFNSIGLLIKTNSDNKNRILGEIKSFLGKHGGTLSSCRFLFNELGGVLIKKEDLEKVLDIELITDFVEGDEVESKLFCEPKMLNALIIELQRRTVEIIEFEIEFIPKTLEKIEKQDEFEEFIRKLELIDDVEEIFHNAEN